MSSVSSSVRRIAATLLAAGTVVPTGTGSLFAMTSRAGVAGDLCGG
ncbi:hypothetical protein ACIQWN_36595 [Streptomyces vinaceus]